MKRRPIGTKGGFKRLHTDDFIDEQFVQPEPRVPTKSIMYAIALFVVGSLLLTIGLLTYLEKIDSNDPDKWLAMIIIGSLMFIPGSYHTYLAYYAWQQYPGFSYADIPDIDN
eukprot:m.149098 g.149098  ORF g.149098 m.149098 type:complete len:112 (-) comp16848_c1_seq5:776-1111(-)